MICCAGTDYEGALKLAHETLITYSNGLIPIDVKYIVKQFKNIKLISLNKFREKMCLTYEEVIDKYGSKHGFTIYDIEKDRYILVYNSLDDDCTQRWTVAHELGHILKGHLKSNDYDLIHYNNGEHPMEKEANSFAKHILAPFPLIAKIKEENKTFNIISPDEISLIFDINFMPSTFIYNHFSKLYYSPRHYRLEMKFYNSIKNLKIGPYRDFQESYVDDFLF